MPGFGSSVGATPFGTGTPATATAPPTVPLARARYIDPVTRDYVLDSEGELERMPPVRQQMMIALTTELGSSSTEPGRGVKRPAYVGKNIERDMTAAVARATDRIVRAGRARLLGVTVEEARPGSTVTTVSYVDLTTGDTDSLRFT